METSMGELISEVVLIDGYSLYLRYYRIREHINSKLRELNSRQGYAQVEIDVCDRLTITFFVNGNKIDEKILVKEGLNKSSDISQKNKRTFIEDINKMFDNINSNQTNKMKKIKKCLEIEELRKGWKRTKWEKINFVWKSIDTVVFGLI